MDSTLIVMLHNSIMFAVSCAFDLVFLCIIVFLFYKLYKTKSLVTSNSCKLHNHDEELLRFEEKLSKE